MRKRARSDCPLCRGSKWLCEEHIPLPWKHDVCDAAGVPCLCNRRQGVRRLRVFAGVPRVDRRIAKIFDRRVLDRRKGDCGPGRELDRRSGERRHQGRRSSDGASA